MPSQAGRRKRVKLFAAIAALLLLTLFLHCQNTVLQVERFSLQAGLAAPVRVVQLSDLHGVSFGQNNTRLLNHVKSQRPDIILFTGDLVSSSGANLERSLHLLKELQTIAPTYYIFGNHEGRGQLKQTIRQGLADSGVTILENQIAELAVRGQPVWILGLCEPPTDREQYEQIKNGTYNPGDYTALFVDLSQKQGLKLAMSHYPENFALTPHPYSLYSYNALFCGHAHGGQFILPFLGGLIAPGQGFFPAYYAGLYEENGAKMLVNRGLGNSLFPFRLFNHPEILVVDFH